MHVVVLALIVYHMPQGAWCLEAKYLCLSAKALAVSLLGGSLVLMIQVTLANDWGDDGSGFCFVETAHSPILCIATIKSYFLLCFPEVTFLQGIVEFWQRTGFTTLRNAYNDRAALPAEYYTT